MDNKENFDLIHALGFLTGPENDEWIDNDDINIQVPPDMSDEEAVELAKSSWLLAHPGFQSMFPHNVEIMVHREPFSTGHDFDMREIYSGSPYTKR